MVNFNCKCCICSKKIYRIPSRLNDHPCCSITCRNKYFSKEKSFVWMGGLSTNKEYLGLRLRINEKIRRKKYKEMAIKLLGGKCKICGYKKCIAGLQFHHTKSLEKNKNVKNLMSGSWMKIEKEIKKCILLCANCHSEIHYKEIENGLAKYKEAFRKISEDIQATQTSDDTNSNVLVI